MLKISIITATFNCQNTVNSAIESVISQNYNNIEYIIIDGASTDKTLEIIKKYSDKINKIISEPDKGIYDALNKGISHASGDFIGFLHSDDIYADSNVISDIVKTIYASQADAVYADLVYVDKNNPKKIFRYWKADEFNFNKIKKGWMPPHPTLFVKKNVYEKIGTFNTEFKISADYDFILRMLFTNKVSVSYLPKTIIKMRTGGASNKSFKNILEKSAEDYKAIKNNKAGGVFTLLFKNISKIHQLFVR